MEEENMIDEIEDAYDVGFPCKYCKNRKSNLRICRRESDRKILCGKCGKTFWTDGKYYLDHTMMPKRKIKENPIVLI